jgi:hypothetical protein
MTVLRLVAVPVVLAVALLSAGPASAGDRTVSPQRAATPAVQTGSYRNLVNEDSGRCLDADANTIGGNGTKVQLWDCNGQTQQYWLLTPSGQGYQIKNERSGRCLDADTNTAGSNGGRVQLWDCNGKPQQQWIDYSDWVVDGSTDINSFYTPLVNRCLDADLTTINANGTKVQLWDCRNSLNPVPWNQHWYQAVIA